MRRRFLLLLLPIVLPMAWIVGSTAHAADAAKAEARSVEFERGSMQLSLPGDYRDHLEEGHRLFFMPPKGDAVGVRVSLSGMVQQIGAAPNAGEMVVRRFAQQQRLELQNAGKHVYVVERQGFGDLDAAFLLTHYHVGVGRSVVMLTVGIAKGHEASPEALELMKRIPEILRSLEERLPEANPPKPNQLALLS